MCRYQIRFRAEQIGNTFAKDIPSNSILWIDCLFNIWNQCSRYWTNVIALACDISVCSEREENVKWSPRSLAEKQNSQLHAWYRHLEAVLHECFRGKILIVGEVSPWPSWTDLGFVLFLFLHPETVFSSSSQIPCWLIYWFTWLNDDWYNSFLHSFMHSFIHSFTHSFIHLSIHSFIQLHFFRVCIYPFLVCLSIFYSCFDLCLVFYVFIS